MRAADGRPTTGRHLSMGAVIAILAVVAGTAMSSASTTGAAQRPTRPAILLTSGPTLPHLRDGALAIDVHGRRHVLGSELIGPGTPGRRHVLTYLTRRPGAKTWTNNRVADAPRIGGRPHLSLMRRSAGQWIVAVVAVCDRNAIYTTEVSARATHLPTPPLAMSAEGYPCREDDHRLSLAGESIAPRNQVALLFTDDLQHGSPLVSIGTVGGSLPDPSPLPDPDGLGIDAVGIARDSHSGRLYVVGNGPDGVYVWTRSRGGTWSEPERIVEHGRSGGYIARSIDANGTVVVGLIDRSRAAGTSDLAIATRSSTGEWSGPSPLPHGGRHDQDLLVRIDPIRERVHAVYDHLGFSQTAMRKDGIYQMVLGDGQWSRQHRMTGRGYDTPLDVALTPSGRAVVNYRYIPE